MRSIIRKSIENTLEIVLSVILSFLLEQLIAKHLNTVSLSDRILVFFVLFLVLMIFFIELKKYRQTRENQVEETSNESEKKLTHLEELQKLFYILLKYGKVSVGEIMKIWKETHGGDSAFIVYEKSSKFKLKLTDLGDAFKSLNIDKKDERRKKIRSKLRNVLPEKSPFSMFVSEKYRKYAAPLFVYRLSPFYLMVFPENQRRDINQLSEKLLSEYLKYAENFKRELADKLSKIHGESLDEVERKVVEYLLHNVEQWDPTEAILVVIPFSEVNIPLGKFSKDALSLLEKYHPNSLETIKEELTKTILKNLTLSAFLEYAKLPFHKIKALEEHEDEIKAKLGIKRWGELFNIDPSLIQNVFSQYNVTEEELKQILNAVEKITEIIERPDRIIRK